VLAALHSPSINAADRFATRKSKRDELLVGHLATGAALRLGGCRWKTRLQFQGTAKAQCLPPKTRGGLSFVVACRVSPRRARYFLLPRQKKVPKEKATLQSALRVPTKGIATTGSETNSLRSNMFRFFIRCDDPLCGALPRVERQHQPQRQHQVGRPRNRPHGMNAEEPVFVVDVPPLETLP